MDFKFIFLGFHFPKNIFHFSGVFIISWVFFCNFLNTTSCLHAKQSEICAIKQTTQSREAPSSVCYLVSEPHLTWDEPQLMETSGCTFSLHSAGKLSESKGLRLTLHLGEWTMWVGRGPIYIKPFI